MKWLLFTVSLVLLWANDRALAQPPAAKAGSVNLSPGTLSPTPEMWFYEQSMHQHQDPKTGVREKAEYRSAQRLRRIAALRWYGISNARPMLGADAIHGDGGPRWTSGSVNNPSQWNGNVSVLSNSASENSSR